VIGIGRIAREHPLAHGICSQLLRILYLAELNGIDGHTITDAEERGRVMRENVECDDDVKGHLAPVYVCKLQDRKFSCVKRLCVKRPLRWGRQGQGTLRVGLNIHRISSLFPFSAPRRDDVWFWNDWNNTNLFPSLFISASKTNGAFLLL
jgi:hypothetical protein